jgi:LytR cell envelope-related transcriptional attenuator
MAPVRPLHCSGFFMTLTLAFSVRNFIENIGAYAGFAAVVAVALFALLLFAQARELKRLRDWGSTAHDRIGELERGLAQALELARRAAVQPRAAQSAPAPQSARGAVARGRAAAGPAAAASAGGPPRLARTAAPVRPQLLPAAPVGVGGPALASATPLIPLPGAPESAPAPAVPARPAAARPAVAAVAAGAGARERVVPRGRDAEPADLADGNGHYDDPPTDVAPRRATPAAARPAGAAPRREAPARGAQPRPRPSGRPPAPPARGGARPAPPEPEPPHGRRRLVGVLVALLALVVVGVAAFVIVGGGDDTPSRTVRVETPAGSGRATRRATRQAARTTPAPAHDTTEVAVLNGTGVTGLASRVMADLTADGYRSGPVGDASDAARTVTVVEYRNGQEAAANEVAKTLGLSADTVSAIRPDSETAACALQTPCTAQVVVTVGADRNPTP